jgi:hypothetical protein
MRVLERTERADSAQPIALPSEAFSSPRMYNLMTYTKPSAVFRMLREYLGTPVFQRVLHEYARRYQFKHVTGEDFRQVAEEVGGQPLGWFWDEWIRRTDKLDYAVRDARARRLPDGRWSTTFAVERAGDAWMPVDVQAGTAVQRLTSRGRRQTVTLTTATKPDAVIVDPRWVLIDYDRSNNTVAVP